MPNDIFLVKSLGGLAPYDADAESFLSDLKSGKPVRAKISLARNVKYHRRFFCMLKCAYDNHDWPEIETQWGPAKCTYDQFRKYITVKCGYFDMVVTPQGNVRAEAKSISFAKMDQPEFEKLYNDALNFILAEYLAPKGWTAEDMNNAVNQMLSFG